MVLKVLQFKLATPVAVTLVQAAGVAEVAGGALVVLGQFVSAFETLGAYIILGLLVVFNALLHNPVFTPGEDNLIQFFKNLSMIGGALILIAGSGAAAPKASKARKE